MNKRLLVTVATIAVALAGAATSAIAVEATQVVPPTGTLTRAEVKADLAGAQAARPGAAPLRAAPTFSATTRVIQLGEATVFVDQPGTRSREAVRDEARAAARSSRGDNTYLGS